jgi:hypothetical protein
LRPTRVYIFDLAFDSLTQPVEFSLRPFAAKRLQATRNVTILANFFKLAAADSHPIRIGLAMKIEEYVPTITPTVMTKANPWMTGPPMM